MFYKHYAIDIADPSSMHDACHMNFVIDLAHRSLCGSVVEHRSVESEGLRFGSSWGLRIFSLSYARDKTKNIFFFFLWICLYDPVEKHCDLLTNSCFSSLLLGGGFQYSVCHRQQETRRVLSRLRQKDQQ